MCVKLTDVEEGQTPIDEHILAARAHFTPEEHKLWLGGSDGAPGYTDVLWPVYKNSSVSTGRNMVMRRATFKTPGTQVLCEDPALHRLP